MTVTTQESALQEALSHLETSLLSPVIAGELLDWVDTVRKAAANLQPRLEAYIRDVLHVQYAEIAKSDTELLFRVERAIADDQKLLDELAAFQSELTALVERAPAAQKNELKVDDLRRDLEDRGTRLVLSVRKHELAVGAWLNEALFRDRGSVD